VKLNEIDELLKIKYAPSTLLEPDRVTHTPEVNQNSLYVSPASSASAPASAASASASASAPVQSEKRKSRPTPEGLTKFNEFIKDYHVEHPELSYTDALMEGSEIWKKKKGAEKPANSVRSVNTAPANSNMSVNSPSKSNMSMDSEPDSESDSESDDMPASQNIPILVPSMKSNSVNSKRLPIKDLD